MRFEPSPEHRGAAHPWEEGRGRDARLQEQLTWGWARQAREQSQSVWPGWCWGSGAGGAVGLEGQLRGTGFSSASL